MALTFNEPRAAGSTSDLASTDFCDPHTYDDPWELFARLRDLEHLHYDEKNDLYIAPRHEDVFHVSRDRVLRVGRGRPPGGGGGHVDHHPRRPRTRRPASPHQ
ncbi:MAG: hypothetical protein R2789_16580 [Microthrixaceae bacterium]